MPIDPLLTDHLVASSAGGADPGIDATRARESHFAKSLPAGPEIASVRRLLIDGQALIPVRMYTPADGPKPCVVYFHGGEAGVGSLDGDDAICRRLATESEVVVLSIDYRRPPEHPWPAALADALAAARFTLFHAIDYGGLPTVALAGSGFGATLAALCAVELKGAVVGQILAYPQFDIDGGDTELLSSGDLDQAPPALIVAAEQDASGEQTARYAQRLRDAGVSVNERVEAGTIPDFLRLAHVSPVAAESSNRFYEAARRLVHGDSA